MSCWSSTDHRHRCLLRMRRERERRRAAEQRDDPHFFAISLKASARFGESLTLRIPWSVKLASMM